MSGIIAKDNIDFIIINVIFNNIFIGKLFNVDLPFTESSK